MSDSDTPVSIDTEDKWDIADVFKDAKRLDTLQNHFAGYYIDRGGWFHIVERKTAREWTGKTLRDATDEAIAELDAEETQADSV